MEKKRYKKFKRILIYLSILISIILSCVIFATISINNYLVSDQEKDLGQFLKINGSLTFKKSTTDILSNFPNARIKFKDVILKDKKITQHKHRAFEAKTVIVTIKLNHWFKNIFELTQIEILDAKVDLYVDKTNYSNIRNIFKSKHKSLDTQNNPYLDIFKSFLNKGEVKLKTPNTKINLSNIDFKIINKIKKKDISLHINKLNTIVYLTDSLYSKTNISVHLDKLTFNTEKGPFLSNSKLEGEINGVIKKHTLNLNSKELKINNKVYNINAQVNLIKGSISKLNIDQEHTKYKEIAPLLSNNIQEKIKHYDILGDFKTSTIITFVPWRRDPKVVINFSIPNNTIIIKGHKLDSAYAFGEFTNRIYDDIRSRKENRKNIRLKIDSAQFLYRKFHTRTYNTRIISSPDLGDSITSKITVNSEASNFSKLLDSKKFLIKKGSFKLKGKVNGSLKSLEDISRKSTFNIKFKNLDVLYQTSGIFFKNNYIEFDKDIDNTKFIFIPNITQHGHISISGKINNIENLIFQNHNHKTESFISIKAYNIIWEELTSSLKNNYIRKGNRKYSTLLKNSLSEIYRQIAPHIDFKVDKFTYSDDIIFKNIKAQFSFINPQCLILNNTYFTLDNSIFKLSSKFTWKKNKNIKLYSKINIKGLELAQFLPKFDYFGINLLHSVKDFTQKIDLDLDIINQLNKNNKISFKNLYANIKFVTIPPTKTNQTYLNPKNLYTIYYNDSQFKNSIFGNIELKFRDKNNVISSISLNSGTPLLNNFLKSQKFNFREGNIKMNFNIVGNLRTTSELIQKSEGNISLINGKVEIKKSNIIIPIDSLHLQLNNDIASYHIKLQHNTNINKINIDGKIKNISSFIFSDSTKTPSVSAKISSNTFEWNKFKEMFSIVKKPKENKYPSWDRNIATNNHLINDNIIRNRRPRGIFLNERKKKEINISDIIKSFKSLALTFSPTISLDIENIIFSEILSFNKLYGDFSIINNIIDIDNISLNYHNGYSKVEGNIDIGKNFELPIHLKIESKSINLKKILEDFKYFNISSLKNAEKLQGILNANMNFNTSFDLASNKNIANKTDLAVIYSLDSVEIKGFNIVDNIAKKIGSRKRLKHIKFAPIVGRFNFDGYTYSVPITELQSNAFQMFVKGHINSDKTKNIWLIIPYSNFKRRNLNFIPSLTGFLNPRKKIYIHLINNYSTKFKNKTHINLSPKKFEEVSNGYY